jgi:large subunit ribosomal protein L29
MKKLELKQKSEQDLRKNLDELRRDLMKLNAQRSTGTVPENPGNIKKFRRTIARVLTILNKKQMEVKSKTK